MEEIGESIITARNSDRNRIFKERTWKHTNRVPLVLIYNLTLPDAKNEITKNWSILHTNQEFKQNFNELPTNSIEEK